jgi:sterile alpha motif and leucine zipper-containing kinase AZK
VQVSLGVCRGQEVAVKELIKYDANDLARFKMECFLTAALRHPHVVRTIGVCWDGSMLGLVMEYMPKGGLDTWLRDDARRRIEGKMRFGDEGLWTWKGELLRMMQDLADAMIYLHNARYYDTKMGGWKELIIHRDLKPANLLIADNMHLKVTDFGEARAIDIEGEMTCVGTPIYVAPEIMKNDLYDAKVDSYSMGVVLFACLRVEPDIFTALCSQLRASLKTHKKRPLSANHVTLQLSKGWRPAVPRGLYPSLGKLIAECMQEEPGKRPSFEEIGDALRGPVAREVYELPEPDVRGDGERARGEDGRAIGEDGTARGGP